MSGHNGKVVDRFGKQINTLPKVMMGLVASDFVNTKSAVSFAAICSNPHSHICIANRDFDVNYPMSIQRNGVVADALKMGVDYLFLMNGDVCPPPNVMEQFFAWGKRDIVGGIYLNTQPPFQPIVGCLPGDEGRKVDKGIIEVASLPMGCMLIDMNVFATLDRPFFREAVIANEGQPPAVLPDFVDFCLRVRAAGFKIWADVTVSNQMARQGKHLFMMGDQIEQAEPAN